MGIGHKIREVRLKRNLTQEFIAHRIGITPQAYCKMESGKTDVSVSKLKKIAKELGVTVGLLADDEGVVVNNYGEVKDGGQWNCYLPPRKC